MIDIASIRAKILTFNNVFHHVVRPGIHAGVRANIQAALHFLLQGQITPGRGSFPLCWLSVQIARKFPGLNVRRGQDRAVVT
jgi:hypothetical protein